MEKQSSKSTSQFSLGKDQSKTINLKNKFCKNGNPIQYACFQKSCQKNAFMCNQSDCSCSAAHQECMKLVLADLLKKINKKIINSENLIKQSQTIIDKFIDTIMDQASRIRDQIKQLAQYFPLSQLQRNILKKINKNQLQKVSGKQLFQLQNQLYNKTQSILPDIKTQTQKLKNAWKNIEANTMNQMKEAQKKFALSFYYEKSQYLQKYLNLTYNFKISKIVKTQEQFVNIKKFFQRKVVGFQLLYRASQNQFKIDAFYKNCCNIPHTMFLLETQFGRKIGGYTPLTWKQNITKDYDMDQNDFTFSSFVFSLTQNQKFVQKDQRCGIKNRYGFGPIFRRGKQPWNGAGSDIIISPQANKNNSLADFSYGYFNKNYLQKSQKSMQKITGSPKGSLFKTLQWQVWRVIFQ